MTLLWWLVFSNINEFDMEVTVIGLTFFGAIDIMLIIASNIN